MNSRRAIIPFIAASLLAACSSEPVEDPAALLSAQNYIAARNAAMVVLREEPKNVVALESLLRAQLAMGLGYEVEATLGRLAAISALPEDAQLIAAEAKLQQGDVAAMREKLAGLASSEAWRLRALGARVEGDDKATIEAFSRGKAASGDKSRLYAAEAWFHLERRDKDAARLAVLRAQAAAPDRIETLLVTARLAQLEEQPEIAARAYNAILQIAPDDRPALLGAIAEFGNLGRVDAVRPLVARGRQTYPDDKEFIYLEARLMAEDEDWEGARELLQKYESELFEHPDSQGLYGQALLEVGQSELARSHLAQLYRRDPDNLFAARQYARALELTGDAARAKEVAARLEQAAARGSSN